MFSVLILTPNTLGYENRGFKKKIIIIVIIIILIILNSLPAPLRLSPSFDSFASNLKTHLFPP